jgi:hypothetical protein
LSTNIYCLSAGNRKRKKCKRLGLVQPKSSSAWHTGLSGGAPDSVWCSRPASGEQATLGKVWRRTTIIHQTIRWCTGLSGEPTAASAMVDHAIRGRRVAHACQRSAGGTGLSGVHRTVSGAPTSPKLQRSSVAEKEIRNGPYTVTVRWRTGLSGAPPDRMQD